MSATDKTERDMYVADLENKVAMLSAFIDNAEAGMYVTDYYTGEILYANRKMVAIGGGEYSVSQLIGVVCWKLLNPGGEGRCPFCPYEKLIDSQGMPKEPYVWENYFPEYDLWLRIISRIIPWVDGRTVQMNTFIDITETKHIQDELAEYARENEHQRMLRSLQEILDKLPIPVRLMDQQTEELLYVNDESVKLFECDSADEIIGRSVVDFLPVLQSDGSDSKERLDTLLHANETVTLDIEYLSQKGKIIDAHVTGCVTEYNGRKCTLGIITDLAAQQEQRRLLMRAAEKEREANRLKSNFLSNMSHEIRTPMNAIIGLTEIELNKAQPKESLDVYRKINISAKSLLEIINDILDLSKIEANKMEIFSYEFALEEVISSAMLVVRPRIGGKRVELRLEEEPDLPRYLIGDKTRLWQMLKNYLDNAAKFTLQGSIVLSVSQDKERSSDELVFLTFSVTDTGVGMDEEQLRKVFLPYEQFYNDIQDRYSGTGLGMPISKLLCELMGGELEIRSTPGTGTSIKFTIPFIRANDDGQEANPTDNEEYTQFSGVRVLVCEDSEINQDVAVGMLEQFGVEAVVAEEGRQGVDLLKTEGPFDLVLMDLHMPVMDGFEATRIIRSSPEFDEMPIISLTADAMTEVIDRCFAAGMNDYLAKPFIMSDLHEVLLKWISKSKHIV